MGKVEGQNHYGNFNRNNKWLGIIDYKSLIILLLIAFVTWNILGCFVKSLIYRVYILVIVLIPLFGLFYANKSQDNISYVIYIVLKYWFSPKLYVYNIESNRSWLK